MEAARETDRQTATFYVALRLIGILGGWPQSPSAARSEREGQVKLATQPQLTNGVQTISSCLCAAHVPPRPSKGENKFFNLTLSKVNFCA